MKRQIIYVDDDSYNLTLFQLQFEKYFDVITCNDPTLVKEIFKNHSISVMVTDYQMPLINGMELIKQMKELNPGLVSIILSGFQDLKDQIDHHLIYGLVAKPYDEKDLLKIIEGAFIQFDAGHLKNVS